MIAKLRYGHIVWHSSIPIPESLWNLH